MSDAIEALLNPRSVAIIGASPDANKLNGRPQHFMQRDGYAGAIYPVNPKYTEISGLTCYPDIASLPEPPDLAVVVVAAARAIQAVADLGDKGTKVGLLIRTVPNNLQEESDYTWCIVVYGREEEKHFFACPPTFFY